MNKNNISAEIIFEAVLNHKLTKAEAMDRLYISRGTFYKRYKKYLLEINHRLNPRLSRKDLRSKILHIVVVEPKLGPKSITEKLSELGYTLSTKSVWLVLVENNLNTVVKRQDFSSKFRKPKVISKRVGAHLLYKPEIRREFVEKVMNGESKVANVEADYQISRKTYSKWKKRYVYSDTGYFAKLKALEDRFRVGSNHPKGTSLEIEKRILNLVTQSPELSSHKLAEKMRIIGNHGIQNVLSRNGLNLMEHRVNYANTHTPETVPAYTALTDRVKSVFEQFTPNTAPAPPPTFSKYINALKYFAATTAFTSIFVFLSIKWVQMVANAPSIGDSVGLVISSVALLSGTFFFAYSFKYYITLALVLSFSQAEGKGSETNTNKSLLSRLLNRNDESKNIKLGESDQAVGLNADLDYVRINNYPFISVQIPFFNEKHVARRAVQAAINFEYGGDYEVIICDDSNDETVDIVRDYQKEFLRKGENLNTITGSGWDMTSVEVRPGVTLKHLHRSKRSGFKGAALGLALQYVDKRTEFVSVFDADFVPYPDTLYQFLKYFKVQNNMSEDYSDSNVAAVQGYQWHVLNKSENWITRGVRTEYSGSYVIERSGEELYGGLKQISGSVYMIRKAALDDIGWGTSITEDFQLTLKLYAKGYKVVFTPYIQAPAECVSTLKRLIKQRMRWAEGHSFNVRRMWRELLLGTNKVEDNERIIYPSPLTKAEKFEFIYLIPYYLQALFFLIGTFSWFFAEAVLQVNLPFWTTLWGWSMVLTNMLALPLMNSVGLFLEESEEKDYAGIASFVVLSYIVVPFQAYAALKGLLESEEGGWFRTPKTGRITDAISRGSFMRLIHGIIPQKSFEGAGATNLSQYISLATSNNRFDTFNIRSHRQRMWIGKSFLTILVLVSTTILTYSPYIGSLTEINAAAPGAGTILQPNQKTSLYNKVDRLNDLISSDAWASVTTDDNKENIYVENGDIVLEGKNVYAQDADTVFEIEIKDSLFTKVERSIKDALRMEYESNSISNVSVKHVREDVEETNVELIKEDSNNYQVKIDQSEFIPGEYVLEVTDSEGDRIVQNFFWGVLAINTDRSIYAPNDRVSLSMGVLDEKGFVLCDATLSMNIIDPDGTTKHYDSTLEGAFDLENQIAVNPACFSKAYAPRPDYEAIFAQTGKTGEYLIELQAITSNGEFVIKDKFEVRDSVSYNVARNAPTRIYPYHSYPSILEVDVNEDYSGMVEEIIPSGFEIDIPTESELRDDYELEVDLEGNSAEFIDIVDNGTTKTIRWLVDWEAGNSYQLAYVFDAPDISPEFYTLGPLWIGGFTESRKWQIASDASGDVILLWDTGNGAVPGGWTSISESSGNTQYYNVYPRGASAYSGSTGGSATHDHTVTHVSQTIVGGTADFDAGAGEAAPTTTHTHTFSSGDTVVANNDPANRTLKFIRSSGAPSTIPQNTIAMFDSTSLPTNWSTYTAIDTKLLKGSNSTANSGSDTHTHAVTGTLTGTGLATDATNAGNGTTGPSTTHTHDCTGTTDSKSSVPAYIEVVFGIATTSTSVAGNIIAMFDAAAPTGWTRVSAWDGKLIRGNSAAYGGTGGSDTHSDHANLALTCAQTANTANLDGTPNDVGATLTHTHTDTVDFDTPSILPVYRDTVFAKKDNNITISGTIRQTNESSVYDCSAVTAVTLHVSVNGGANTNVDCTSSGGTYTVDVPAPGSTSQPIAVFIDSAEATKGTTVTLPTSTSANISNLDIYVDRLIVTHEGGTAMANSYLATADNADAGIRYSVASSNLTVETGIELHVKSSKTFTPGGTVTTQGGADMHVDDSATTTLGNATNTIADDLLVDGGATININASTDINGGAITTSGTSAVVTTTSGTPTVTMNGTGDIGGGTTPTLTFYTLATTGTGTTTIANTTTVNNNLTVAGTSATLIVAATTTVTNDVSVAAGTTLTINANLNIDGGDLTNTTTGIINTSSGTPTVDIDGTGTLGGGNSGTITIYNLDLGDGTTDTTTLSTTAMTISNGLTINTAQTFAMGTNSLTIGSTSIAGSGDLTVNGATTQSASGTITILGNGTAGSWDGTGELDAYNLTIGNASATLAIDNDTTDLALDIANNFTVTANATFNASSSDAFTIANNYTNNGIFEAGTGTVTMDAGDAGNTLAGTMTTTSAFNDLTFNNSAGSWSFSAAATIDDDFAITSATAVTAPSGTLIVKGDFAGGSAFADNDGTVSLEGAANTTQAISGSTNFHHLSATTTANRLITFVASTTTTIETNGNLTLTGTSCSAMLVLKSATPATQFTLTDGTGGSTSVSYVDVQDSNATNAITATNSVNSGNNTNWTIAANTCKGTSSNASATGYSFQRKTFWDETNQRYWLFYHDGDEIEIRYSSDNVTWNVITPLAYDTNDFSVWNENISGTEYVFLAVTNSNDIKVRQGTLSSSSITWDSDVATMFDGTGASDDYSYPYISLDSSKYVWLMARHLSGSNYTVKVRDTSVTGNTDPVSWTYNTATQISDDQTNSNVYGNIVPLASPTQDMYATFVSGTALEGCLWDDSDAAWENSANASCAVTSGSGGESTYFDSLETNLTGYWKLNESSWNGTTNEVVDSSGNGYHATAAGNATTTAAGFSRSGSFDGTGDYASRASFQIPSQNGTVSAWVYPIEAGGGYDILGGGISNNDFRMSPTNNLYGFYIGSEYRVSYSTDPTQNAWTLVTLTWDQTNGSILYYNGARVASNSTPPPAFSQTGIYIGSFSGSDLQGRMDDVRVYSRALSAEEIAILYQSVPESVNIDDASDFGGLSGSGRQIIRTSTGVLYSFVEDAGNCEMWKSTNGVQWTNTDSETCTSGTKTSAAVDSSNDIHVVYSDVSGSNFVEWAKYSTATDTFGTPEQVKSTADILFSLSIAVDASNIPHVAWGQENDPAQGVRYRNRVGGSWQTERTVESGTGTGASYTNIVINEDNIPEISYINSSENDLTAAVGNVNNAATFTLQDVDVDINDTDQERGVSMAVSYQTGDSWIAYTDDTNKYIALAKHADADAWSTWSTVTTKTDVGYEPSIAISGSSDIYVFYENDTDDISYDVYNSDAGSPSWSGETVLHTGTFQDVKAKWAFKWNNFGSNRIDYLYSDGTDIFYDYLHLRRMPTNVNDASDFLNGVIGQGQGVVRTSTGILYAAFNDPNAGDNSLEVWKSTDGGNSWTEMDSADKPTGIDSAYGNISMAIDNTNVIHIAYPGGSGGSGSDLRYVSFTTSTDQFGTSEEAIDCTTQTAECATSAIAVDSSNIPHVITSSFNDGTSVTELLYSNRVGGSWDANTPVVIETSAATGTVEYATASIAIDEDNLAEVAYLYDNDDDLTVGVADANDASSFILYDVDTDVADAFDGGATSIAVDSSGNTWVSYIRNDGLADDVTLTKRTDGSEVASWSTGWTIDITNNEFGYDPWIAVDGGNIYVFYNEDQDDIVYDKYNGSSWSGETSLEMHGSGVSTIKGRWALLNNPSYDTYGIDYLYTDGTDAFYNRLVVSGSTPGSQDAIDTVTSGITKTLSSVVDSTNNDVHLLYIADEATDKVGFRRWDSGTLTWDALSMVSDAASDSDSYPTISYDSTGTDLYALWIDTSTGYIHYSVCDISTECDADADWAAETTWKNTGTNTNITSNYADAGRIFAEWTVGSASPYTINFDTIIVPEYIWLFMLAGPLIPYAIKNKKRKREAEQKLFAHADTKVFNWTRKGDKG